jgi:hypothetical protein
LKNLDDRVSNVAEEGLGKGIWQRKKLNDRWKSVECCGMRVLLSAAYAEENYEINQNN